MVQLFAVTCGWFELPLTFFVGGEDKTPIKSPIPAYLIKHPKGMALFDTGLGVRYRRAADAQIGGPGPDFDESADIAMRLRAMDVDPAEVKWIINSHLHLDHCGGNASIPNATVIVQSRELAVARAQADGKMYNPLDYEVGHPFLAIDGEYDLYGDGSVILFPTFGHTPGHQSARVKLPGGDVILAADCCYLKRNLDELTTSPTDHDRAASLETLRRLSDLRGQGVRIFYGHDPEFWRGVPQARALE